MNGKTIGENLQGARVVNHDVIRARNAVTLMESGGTAILYGSLAPDGAVIKTVAAEKRFWQHTGPAVASDFRDLEARIHREDLNVTADSVLVLRHAGRCWVDQGCLVRMLSHSTKSAVRPRRAGYGAHLRRAHERNGIRYLRAACFH